MIEHDESQLTLSLEVRRSEEVYWINGQEVPTRRRFLLFGARVVKTVMVPNHKKGLPYSTTSIDTRDINDVRDPNLRYALRFKSAACSVGSFATGEYSSAWHNVSVVATNEGANSRFLGATYSGIHDGGKDTFMDSLRRYEPLPDVPGTVYLVQKASNPDL